MDLDRLDVLARSLASSGSRRTLLGLLAAAPGIGGLTAFTPGDVAAKNRRKRRKQRQKRRKHSGAGKKPKPSRSCRPRPDSETCAGKCGGVRNNCKKLVDCGPCMCDPACGPCERCNGTTCDACEACCHDACCDGASAVCHAGSGDCCVPDANEQTCVGKCGEIVNNCGLAVDCGPCREGLTCAACAALDDPDHYDQAADCCGELVCDCGQIEYYPGEHVIQCKRPGVCRPNHAPVALGVDTSFVRERWGGSYPIFLGGYEPDREEIVRFRIISLPRYGSFDWESSLVFEPGTPALPAPPVPEDAQWNCFPRCTSDAGDQCEYEVCTDEICPGLVCPDCQSGCPEGTYFYHNARYVPFDSGFEGVDSFTYSLIDGFGAEGPPALAVFNIYGAH
jgi:hypothetical protein